MKQILKFSLLGIRLYIFVKVIYLLYMTSVNPTEYPVDNLTWWIYFLIFEIWCSITIQSTQNTEEED